MAPRSLHIGLGDSGAHAVDRPDADGRANESIILANVAPVGALTGLAASGGVLNAGAAVNAVEQQIIASTVSINATPPAISTSTNGSLSFTVAGRDVTTIACSLARNPPSRD
jgi:hypothetical protein